MIRKIFEYLDAKAYEKAQSSGLEAEILYWRKKASSAGAMLMRNDEQGLVPNYTLRQEHETMLEKIFLLGKN